MSSDERASAVADGYRRLVAAVLIQAAIDCHAREPAKRQAARAWLGGEQADDWAAALGIRLDLMQMPRRGVNWSSQRAVTASLRSLGRLAADDPPCPAAES
jgi:hypothetical protein